MDTGIRFYMQLKTHLRTNPAPFGAMGRISAMDAHRAPTEPVRLEVAASDCFGKLPMECSPLLTVNLMRESTC